SLSKLENFKVPLATAFPQMFQINIYDYVAIIPVLVILLLSVISLQQKLYRSYVHIRKAYLMLFFIFIFSILSFFILAKHPIYHFLLAIPAASVFMGFYFTSATKAWFYESLYLILVGFIVYFQFI
ncbi:MAG: beta-carotene 15,15'-monooxygenase, partial [Pyrinomonadaceae bacterium]|nr:beta-carotene 15,15'-monooxygenase [Sphingobacteriaceae bacterium]